MKLIICVTALILLTASALSLARTISSTNDNIYTMIRNSKGNYWETNESNIQIAIDDLVPGGGTVWLPGATAFFINETVVIKENVILDMKGASIEVPDDGNLTMVELKNGAGIKNGVIDVAGHVGSHTRGTGSSDFKTYTNFTEPNSAIFLNATSNIESALIENMALESIGLGYNNDVYHYFTIYFNSSTENSFWENSGNLVDGSTSTYAVGNDTDSIRLNNNTYNPSYQQGGYGPRNITEVYLRAYVEQSNESKNVTLTPFFANGSLGDIHLLSNESSGGYTDWVNITGDTGAPSTWAWSDLENLDCYSNASVESGHNVSVSRIEIRVYTNSTPAFYDPDYSGRGYGIHLYAGNYSVPQKISGVTVKSSSFRNFKNAIFLQNERDPQGNEPGAHIDGNTFEDLWIDANEHGIVMSRNTNAPRENCSISGNVFNLLGFQPGGGGWWGGDGITWSHITISGYGNVFTNIMCWDPALLRTEPDGVRCNYNGYENCTSVILTNDSLNTYMMGRCAFDSYMVNNGTNNIFLDTSWSALNTSSVITKGI